MYLAIWVAEIMLIAFWLAVTQALHKTLAVAEHLAVWFNRYW